MRLNRAFVRVVAFLALACVWAGVWLWVEMTKGQQKRTYANLQTVHAVAEFYAKDHGTFPPARDCFDLQRFVVPKIIKARSLQSVCRDAWGHALHYNYSEGWFVVASPGRDGRLFASTARLFARRGAPEVVPGLVEELEGTGPWYDMDLVSARNRSIVTRPVLHQSLNGDSVNPPPLLNALRWVALIAAIVWLGLDIRATFWD